MNPYWIGGGILIAGIMLAAATAEAAGECEVTEEWVVPYPHLAAAVLMRRCVLEDGPDVVLWDVALLEDVVIGPDQVAEQWPESMFHGQAADHDTAIADAMAWLDRNVQWLQAGGQRSPLAERVETFLGQLTPGQLAELREVFRFEGTAVSDAWPYVDELRTATTDDDFYEIGRQLGSKLSLLTDDERDALQGQVLGAVGFSHGFTLKGILGDAGIM